MAQIEILKGKINGFVTQSSISYKGSITIDADFMDELGIRPFEAIEVNNVNGNRDRTYVIPGIRGSKIIGCNGALAARHNVSDIIHLNVFKFIEENEYPENYNPKVIELRPNY